VLSVIVQDKISACKNTELISSQRTKAPSLYWGPVALAACAIAFITSNCLSAVIVSVTVSTSAVAPVGSVKPASNWTNTVASAGASYSS